MKDVIIETSSMTRFNNTADAVLASGRMSSGFILAYGRAGRGKSVAADRYYINNGGAYIRVWQNWTQTAFLQRLLFEVRGFNGGMPRHNAARCKELIVEVLEHSPKPIYVDEADRLHIDRIEDLRDIFEMTAVPIVLIGEEGIWGLLEQRRRIMSRVAYEVEFTPISEMEVGIYAKQAANLKIKGELCKRIAKHAEGDFRAVRNTMLLLEKTAKANATDTVDETMLTMALASTLRRRTS